MDAVAITMATDEDIGKFGLVRKGDVLALRAFCTQPSEDAKEERTEKKRKLLQVLKSKLPRTKISKKNVEDAPAALSVKKTTRKISVGWQHFNDNQNRYVLVRLGRGGGTRDISISTDSTKDDVLKEMLDIFFPNGNSIFGDASTMKFMLGNFKGDEIKHDGFTLAGYIAQHKLSKVRLYLLSQVEEGNETISLSDSEDDMPPAFESRNEAQSSSILLGSSSERTNIREQQDEEFRESLLLDQFADFEKEQVIERMKDEMNKSECLYKSRCERVLEEPSIDDHHAMVSVRHVTLGVISRRFPRSCQISSLYDWIGSLNLYPAHFNLSSSGISKLHPTSSITLVDRALVNMAECDEKTTFPDESSNEFTVPRITENIPDVLLVHDDEPIEYEIPNHPDRALEHDAHVENNNDESNTLQQTGENGNHNGVENENIMYDDSRPVRVLKLRRVNIMCDMVDIFKDESVMGCAIKVVMINSSGKLELGVDNHGVFRDALSAFWSQFYDSCTVGEQERVPVVRHDFQVSEWTAIARILVKGYKDVNFSPIKLSRVFISTVLFNEEEITNDLMIESFLSYISSDEKDLVTEALKNDKLSEEQNEEWEEFLERFGSRKIPNFEQRFDVILEISHKELMQVAQYIIDSWKKPIKDTNTFENITKVNDLKLLYEKCKPTVKKVLGLIEATPSSEPQRDVLSYLKRYIRGLKDDKLAKFLRFCTGATIICIEKIVVDFTNLEGLERRPIAHICGATLELPTTYSSFPQFREEMNNILSSEFWDIDIC